MARRERPTALLVDLDGVLRRWDPETGAAVERRYGLPAGALYDTAMRWSLLQPAVTGQLSHAGWLEGVAEALAEPAGGAERARAAVDEWQADRGSVDPDVLGFVREVRAAGIRVGLASNATDLLDADLALLGLTDEVDVVVNSSTLGVAKPAKEYFQQACLAVGVPPAQVLFVDDSDRSVRGARVAGLSAYRWNGPADLRYLRAALAR
ncbi:HAD-IA family hydrolase [Micromonospora sp. WMMD1102]|uniref:HAD-IA family hydrolase n=1 Tax=Micromonospora sp. WMMD1102 TaxID=3016105 RepID=UPI00241525A8|nr:HAD-IA family hydrolase [Micromonospora sp. WMMD1102]MDG4785551.1 HAD-IA family hydrolase [Micromonospora sp. WMMD1102]